MVRTLIPHLQESLTISFKTLTLSWCPADGCSLLALAHLPFLSMIIATCLSIRSRLSPFGKRSPLTNASFSSSTLKKNVTRTGKTLSIICSAMQWIVDQKLKSSLNPKAAGKDSRDQSATDDDEPNWMRNFSRAKTTKKMKKLGFGLGSCNKKCSDGNCANPVTEESRKRVERKRNVEGVDDDEEFLVEEYDNGDEGIDGGIDGRDLKRKAGDGCFSSSDDDREEEKKQEKEEVLKVYFCNRTHSQLSQFVKELKRKTFSLEMKIVCLGSRKNFCINSSIFLLLDALHKIHVVWLKRNVPL